MSKIADINIPDTWHRILTFTLWFAAVAFPCLVIYEATSSSFQFSPQSSPVCASRPPHKNYSSSDADIMWFRDPFPRFYKGADFQIACDNFIGNSFDLNNRPNGGFTYVKSNNRTIEFYKYWYSSRKTHPGYHDQDVLNKIKQDPFITEIGLTIRFLNTAYFGGLCEPSKHLTQVCTMHANCCYGLDSKLHDLKVMLDDWRRYMALPSLVKRLSIYSWRVPQNCSLLSRRHFSPPPADAESEETGLLLPKKVENK